MQSGDNNTSFKPAANGDGGGVIPRPALGESVSLQPAIGEPILPGGSASGPTPATPPNRPSANQPPPSSPPTIRSQTSDSRPGQPRKWRSAISTLLLFLLAPLIALFIMAFVIQSYQVEGQSMESTLHNGDRLIVDKIPRSIARITRHPYIPSRGDIIIFNETGVFDGGGPEEKQLIKRVIGLPGDKVVIKNGEPLIFNTQHPNGFNPDKTLGYTISATTAPDSSLTLSKNQVFVMGDNRTNSEDSRYFGPINASQIVGKLVLRLMPLNQLKTF